MGLGTPLVIQWRGRLLPYHINKCRYGLNTQQLLIVTAPFVITLLVCLSSSTLVNVLKECCVDKEEPDSPSKNIPNMNSLRTQLSIRIEDPETGKVSKEKDSTCGTSMS